MTRRPTQVPSPLFWVTMGGSWGKKVRGPDQERGSAGMVPVE
jgi:hypothetical protein